MKRFHELDSLRGLAALIVVLSHIITLFFRTKPTFDQSKLFYYLEYTPLRLFFSAHESVIFFFVLSGYALSLQFLRNEELSPLLYGKFLVRRIIRIYTPYLIAVIIAIKFVFLHYPFPNSIVWGHVLLIGTFNYVAIMGVVWSLVHEMRISLVFPLLMAFLRKVGWLPSLCFAFGLSCFASYMTVHHPYYNPQLPLTNYYATLHYISLFLIGAILAKHKDYLTSIFEKHGSFARLFTLFIGVIIFTNLITQLPSTPSNLLNDWAVALGVSIIIVAALSMKNFSKILLFPPVHFLGKISYSLYLIHLLVLMYLLNHYGTLNSVTLSILGLTISIASASILYYCVELPSISLGKILTRRRSS